MEIGGEMIKMCVTPTLYISSSTFMIILLCALFRFQMNSLKYRITKCETINKFANTGAAALDKFKS